MLVTQHVRFPLTSIVYFGPYSGGQWLTVGLPTLFEISYFMFHWWMKVIWAWN